MKYILVFVWAFILAVYGLRKPSVEVNISVYNNQTPWLLAILAFLPVVLISCFRGSVFDTSAYIGAFENMPENWKEINTYMQSVKKDKGFYWLSCWIKAFITHKPTVYLSIIAVFQGISLLVFFRKYSCRYLVSSFLFIASAEYISWMHNGLRQFTAVTIVLFATPFILKRRYLPAIAIIMLASTIHQSALIMIPFMLVSMGRAWNSRTLLFIVGVILAIVFVDRFTNLMDDALVNTQYAGVVENFKSGTNLLRVLIYSWPAVFSFLGRKVIRYEDNTLINFCTNMSIITAGVYFISSVTSGIYVGRLPIYASLYGYVLLPWEIDNLFNPKSEELLYIGMFIAYTVFYYYQMHNSWGLF